jgi:hypothetical protein
MAVFAMAACTIALNELTALIYIGIEICSFKQLQQECDTKWEYEKNF